MKKFSSILVLLTVFALSCQKELATADTDGPADEIPGLLKKMVSYTLPDSTNTIVEDFIYDGSGRLMGKAFDFGVFRGHTNFYRDANGRIKRMAFASSQNNWDTVFTDVIYENATSTRVSYLSDSSAVFFYDANNRVSRTDTYQAYPNPGNALKLVVYHLYSYDASGNTTKREEYVDRDGNGSFKLNFTYRLEYDNNINPLHPLDDALIEWQFLARSPNNLTKQMNDPADPSGTDDENITIYEYGSDQKPQAALFMGGDGRKVRTKYYYY